MAIICTYSRQKDCVTGRSNIGCESDSIIPSSESGAFDLKMKIEGTWVFYGVERSYQFGGGTGIDEGDACVVDIKDIWGHCSTPGGLMILLCLEV